jgi:hypothetical protein
MDKTWTVVGTSVKRGEKKLRLANGTAEARQRVLEKDGHTEVRLFDLPNAMTEADARAWLEAQGDAVPQRKPAEPKVVAPKVVRTARERTVDRLADDLVHKAVALAYEEMGRRAYKEGRLGFLDWDDISLETRQEISRNAAIKAGIKCPPGTYPELEAFYRKEKIKITEDGTLVQC